MDKPVKSERFPAWLRFLGWLAFSVLGLVTVLVVAWWLVMSSGHQATLRIVKVQRKPSPGHALSTPAATIIRPIVAQGTPLASLPHFGEILTGDEKGWAHLWWEMEAMSWYGRTRPGFVDGLPSFRAILPSLGTAVPETMTEAEAAAVFLKRAGRFSGLLAQWREALAKGPFAPGGPADWKSNPGIYRFRSLSSRFVSFLEMTGEAHLQAGDTAAAWRDWQTMRISAARVAELFPLDSDRRGSMDFRMFGLARAGVQVGAWTDDQLAELSSVVSRENALASARRDLEREKISVTDYYTNFDKHEAAFSKDFLNTSSPVNQMINQVKLHLITEQQIQDNLEMKLYQIDRRLSRFDPETGFYRRPSEVDPAPADSEASSGLSGSFYFMISDLNGGHGYDNGWASSVIRDQSRFDQFRLAAALGTYQRQTGNFPDHLDAISDRFPGGAPRDIATGQPYFYQRDVEGYTLWGTGIDGTSEGGNEKTDVTWKHRPLKRK